MMTKKILVIMQRSNGDVFLSSYLIDRVFEFFDCPIIDLLINDDTVAIAKTIKHVNKIHLFSYKKKKENRFSQEFDILRSIYKKYDISINLTASDRSTIYAILASKYSISAIDLERGKSWWKKILLKKTYIFDVNQHILKNNQQPLKLLGIPDQPIVFSASFSKHAMEAIQAKLREKNIDQFILFHPSAQYEYKIYPKHLRDQLFELLGRLNIPIILTGSKNGLDMRIKKQLPNLNHLHDFIGETTIEEWIALSYLSVCYIGMDTLNMHIAASQNKRIFAILGPTLLSTWSPWSNALQRNAHENKSQQTYDNITIFQADIPCVACGLAGCDDQHGRSECLYRIDPMEIFRCVQVWYLSLNRII